jgi:hypothetical protein
MKKSGILVASLMMLPAASSAAVYQCDKDGQTVFSDVPCGPNAQELDHTPAPALGGQFDTNSNAYSGTRPQPKTQAKKANPCPHIDSTTLRRLKIQNKIRRGMLPADVRKSWGAPGSVRTGGTTQWAYHYSGGSSNYVYFRDGCVSDFSSYTRNY